MTERGTPKSFRSTAQKSKILSSTSSYFDHDIEMEKEYLQKLKAQRIKAQKLYTQYKAVAMERDRIKSEKQDLLKEVQGLRQKYETAYQQSKSQVIKLKCLNDRLQSQNRSLRTEQVEFLSFKHRYENSMKDLERQVSLFQQQSQNSQGIIEQLQEEINTLERQNRSIRDEFQDEIAELQMKLNQTQGNYQKVQKQMASEKEIFAKSKSLWEQEREQLQQGIVLKGQQMKTLKIEHERQISQKDRLYQIAVSELQENKMFWRVKLDQRSRELQSAKKTAQSFKQEFKKLKIETQKQQSKSRQSQQKQGKLRQTIQEITTKLNSKETEYSELSSKYMTTSECIRKLQIKIEELERALKACEQTNKRLSQNCEEYLKIIEKMERQEQRRLFLAESEYEEIDKMEQIFSTFQ